MAKHPIDEMEMGLLPPDEGDSTAETPADEPQINVLENTSELNEVIATNPVLLKPPKLKKPDDVVSVWLIITIITHLIWAKDNRLRIITAIALCCANVGLSFLSPLLLAELFSSVTSDDNKGHLAGMELSSHELLGLLILSYSSTRLINNARDLVMASVTGRTVAKLMADGIEHQLHESIEYHANTGIQDKIICAQKSFTLTSFIAPPIAQIFPTGIQMIVAAALLASKYDAELGSSMGLLFVVYSAYSAVTAPYILRSNATMLDRWNDFYDEMLKSMTSYTSMRDFDKLKDTMAVVHQVMKKWGEALAQTITRPSLIDMGHSIIAYGHMLWAMSHILSGISSGRYSLQTLMVVTGYLLTLSTSLPEFGRSINQLFAGYPDIDKVIRKLQERLPIVDLHPDNPLTLDDTASSLIEFENVSFSYPEQEGPPLIKNLSFKIEANQNVVLVGESGSGKSTILNLLMLYLRPTAGRILIGGKDTSLFSEQSVRALMRLVRQQPNLFNGTVRDNVFYGAKKRTPLIEGIEQDEKILETAEKLKLYDFLMALKRNLYTDVGDGGAALSGGERQKIAIMRACIEGIIEGQMPPILLLDEITAALDGNASNELLNVLNELLDVTRIMITHKLTRMEEVDLILVLDKGALIAQGTHKELMKRCPQYKKLWLASNETASQVKVSGQSFFASDHQHSQTVLSVDEDDYWSSPKWGANEG